MPKYSFLHAYSTIIILVFKRQMLESRFLKGLQTKLHFESKLCNIYEMYILNLTQKIVWVRIFWVNKYNFTIFLNSQAKIIYICMCVKYNVNGLNYKIKTLLFVLYSKTKKQPLV